MDDAQNEFPADLLVSTPTGSEPVAMPAPAPAPEPMPVADPFAPLPNFGADDLD